MTKTVKKQIPVTARTVGGTVAGIVILLTLVAKWSDAMEIIIPWANEVETIAGFETSANVVNGHIRMSKENFQEIAGQFKQIQRNTSLQRATDELRRLRNDLRRAVMAQREKPNNQFIKDQVIRIKADISDVRELQKLRR